MMWKKAHAPLAALALVLSLTLVACSKTEAERDQPSETVFTFFSRFERFDTAGMAELACAGQEDKLINALSIMQALMGLGGLYGIETTNLSWEDPEVSTVVSYPESASVHVGGRFNFGPPIGSVTVDEEVGLRKEGNRWCIDLSEEES